MSARGDKVKGKIVAKYYCGEPVKDHPLVYEIPGFFIREARTSPTGEVAFEFDTREFVESQLLTLQARLPEDNVAAAKNLWIATRAFGSHRLLGDVPLRAADQAGGQSSSRGRGKDENGRACRGGGAAHSAARDSSAAGRGAGITPRIVGRGGRLWYVFARRLERAAGGTSDR